MIMHKATLMHETTRLLSACLAMSFIGIVFAASAANTWKGGNSSGGGWAIDANWTEGRPTPGSTVEIPNSVKLTANDADMEIVSGLGCIKLSNYSTITFDLQQDAVLSGGLKGGGYVVKKGPAKLQYACIPAGAENYEYYLTECGLTVEEGSLWLPQGVAQKVYLTSVTVQDPGMLMLNDGGDVQMTSLKGSGLVTNDTATTRTLSIGSRGSSKCRGEFSGRLHANLYVNSCGYTLFTGKTNTFRSIRVWGNDNSGSDYGIIGLSKLGNKGEPSSIGVSDDVESRLSGTYLYLGEGEMSDKTYWYRTQQEPPTIWDAGVNGGLVFTGKWYQYTGEPAMGRLVLTGSNTVNACVLSNAIETVATKDGERVTTYITKKGSGIWRFADGPDRSKLLGGFGVDEGTLQFESIAETNVMCSLGMATRLAEDYYGSWDPAKATDYAYRLGCATSANAVFEFIGSKSCATTTRRIALGGDAHLRANGTDGAALSFAGVTALADGPEVKILTLDGDSAEENVLSEVADGASCVGITKDGCGTWVLAGNQTFRGPLYVKGGTLKVRKNTKYSWYRFTVTDVGHNAGPFWMAEFGLFDRDGIRRDQGLSFDQIGSNAYVSYPGPTGLAEGKITYGFPGTYYNYAQNMNLLFDGAVGDGYSFRFVRSGSVPTQSDSTTWISLVAHLQANIPEITAYDYAVYQDIWHKSDRTMPKSFSMEGSVDGKTWTMLHAVTNAPHYADTDKWVSDGEAYVSGEVRKGKGYTIVGHDGDDLSVLESVESIGVATGALLTAEAAKPIVVDTLQVNVEDGVGTLVNFRLAANGTLRVKAPKGQRAVTLPLDFSGVSGLDCAAGWDIEVNGRKNSGWSFKLTESELELLPPGFILLIK